MALHVRRPSLRVTETEAWVRANELPETLATALDTEWEERGHAIFAERVFDGVDAARLAQNEDLRRVLLWVRATDQMRASAYTQAL
jgi:hypothetical protein